MSFRASFVALRGIADMFSLIGKMSILPGVCAGRPVQAEVSWPPRRPPTRRTRQRMLRRKS